MRNKPDNILTSLFKYNNTFVRARGGFHSMRESGSPAGTSFPGKESGSAGRRIPEGRKTGKISAPPSSTPYPLLPASHTCVRAQAYARTLRTALAPALLGCALVLLCSFSPSSPVRYKTVTPGTEEYTTLQKALRKGGATVRENNPSAVILTDEIEGTPCTVTLPKKSGDRPPYLEVRMPDRESWQLLQADYEKAQGFIRKTNGAPVRSVRENNARRYTVSRGNLQDLRDGYYIQNDIWETSGGRITLSLESATDTVLTRALIIYENF